ncbi:cytidine deaminase [Echinicola sediminis]
MGKKIEQKVSLSLLDFSELTRVEQGLIEQAKKALKQAYAPYSAFNVGAAVLLENGKILSANNQENAAFPVGVCAERILLGYASANFPQLKPLQIAIAAQRSGETGFAAISPCGLCRQTISEYEKKFDQEIAVLMLTPDEKILKAENISQLLPFKFNELKG